jgi:eukaryotic-like serine/threonine-protein kinase
VTAPLRLSRVLEIPRGTTLGKYEVLRKIATGGMAEIYLARVRGTAGFEKLVVLKRILPTVATDPTFVRMFLDEARLAATLQHPNIADVYDVGEADGAYFFTMEFVHGEDARGLRFATRKRNERPPLAIALAIVQGTASALDYAHDKQGPSGPLGLVHRDISASNILISYDGAVKLVDFGIARAAARETKTRTGTLKGKIPYMSPEQCRGSPLDRRSDLFSLGIVLYELTVGRRPFRGENDFQIMEQIVRVDPPRPTALDPSYPPALEAIVMKLLSRELDARYQTAEELLHDLEAFTAQHNLWASQKAISRHMRTLFADKIAQWEASEREGISLGQHVVQTVTANSQASDLVTPPTAMPALPPAELPPTGSMPVAAPLADPVSPQHEPRRRGLVIVTAAVVTIAAAVGGFVVVGRTKSKRTSAVDTSSPREPVAAPAAVPTARPDAGVEAASRVATDAATTEAGDAVDAGVGADADVRREPAVEAKPTRPTRPTRPAPTKQDTRPKKPKTEVDTEWDPNSPFLPSR